MDVRDYRVPMEVLDTDNKIIHLISREILLVIYSITDRSSLLHAGAILDNMSLRQDNHVLLLGNKLDLDHLREVNFFTKYFHCFKSLYFRFTRAKDGA